MRNEYHTATLSAEPGRHIRPKAGAADTVADGTGRPIPGFPQTLKIRPLAGILVSMTRITPNRAASTAPGRWRLQDAKARFSELVRLVRSEGPQHVTVHGRDEVVVIAAEEFNRMKGERTGELLIAALQSSPSRDVEIEPRRDPMPVRDVRF